MFQSAGHKGSEQQMPEKGAASDHVYQPSETSVPGGPGGVRPGGVPMGHERWAIAEGYIPSWSHGPEPQFTSHETACLLNAGDEDAHAEIRIYLEARGSAGPYTITVPARRPKHVRFNELTDPEPIPRDTDYASVISSDVPIVVQHTRLDSRQAEARFSAPSRTRATSEEVFPRLSRRIGTEVFSLGRVHDKRRPR
jgi:hypothetical protein